MTASIPACGFPLADDLFLIALNDANGRPRLQQRIFGIGLAGALLGELIFGHYVTVRDGWLYPGPVRPQRDPLLRATAERLRAEPHHDLRTWVAFLAASAEMSVAWRLQRGGWIAVRPSRRLFGNPTVTYPPTDRTEVPWRSVRLARLLTARTPMDLADRMLAALVAATGLHHHVLIDADRAVHEHLDAVAASLPAPLAEVATTVTALVGQAVLTRR